MIVASCKKCAEIDLETRMGWTFYCPTCDAEYEFYDIQFITVSISEDKDGNGNNFTEQNSRVFRKESSH